MLTLTLDKPDDDKLNIRPSLTNSAMLNFAVAQRRASATEEHPTESTLLFSI